MSNALSTAFGVTFNLVASSDFFGYSLGVREPIWLVISYWVLNVALFLVAQNIMIAILSKAYDEAVQDPLASASLLPRPTA